MLPANIKYLRNYSGLNQTAFGTLFGATRGMIDSYERGTAKPSTEMIGRIAKHYNLSVEIMTEKDLRLNPGLMFANAPVSAVTATAGEDLLRAKDDLIKELKGQIKYLQSQNEALLSKLQKVTR